MNAVAHRSLQADFDAKPRPAKLAHVVLRTPDLARMRRFYMNLLDAKPTYENDQVCFMTYDEEHHRIGLVQMPGLAKVDQSRAGLEHIAFTYKDLPTLLAAYSHNKAAKIEPFWTINHGPTISLYYRDPDGNKVELQHDVFDDESELDAFFASGAYDENFMGIVIDPDKLVADYEAGAPIETLTVRPKLPDGATPWDMFRP